MRIAAIDSFPVKLAFKEPFVIANGAFSDLYYVIVRLQTDVGVTGYGEAIPAWEVTGETVFGVIDAVGHMCEPGRTGLRLIGRSIDTLDAVREAMEDLNPSGRPQAVWGAPGAKAALEAAMLDALGRHLGQPVCALFGGMNERVPVADVIGIGPVEETLGRVEAAARRGPPVIKLKVGVAGVDGLEGFGRDVEVVRQAARMLSASGGDTRLSADANQGFVTAERSVAFARQVEGCLAWLEQPALADDRSAFRRIREQIDTKLMADESVHTRWDARLLLELGGVDYLNLKLMKTGGMIEALRIADLAAEQGVACQMGSMLESQVGCAACAHAYLAHPNIVTTELCALGMLRESVGSGLQVEAGGLRLPDAPGLGVRVSPEEIARFRIAPADVLTYRRALDGFPL
jgi:L-alanine-DL-glutamate epimerase-like enolase superfamily enzyme